MLVAAAVNLMAVGIHGQDQDHDTAHNTPGHGAHRCAFDHVQGDHLIPLRKTTDRQRVTRQTVAGLDLLRGELNSLKFPRHRVGRVALLAGALEGLWGDRAGATVPKLK